MYASHTKSLNSSRERFDWMGVTINRNGPVLDCSRRLSSCFWSSAINSHTVTEVTTDTTDRTGCHGVVTAQNLRKNTATCHAHCFVYTTWPTFVNGVTCLRNHLFLPFQDSAFLRHSVGCIGIAGCFSIRIYNHKTVGKNAIINLYTVSQKKCTNFETV